MKAIRFVLPVLLTLPGIALAANKEMIELQRDVAQLQDQMRLLQQSFDAGAGRGEQIERFHCRPCAGHAER